MQKLIGLIALVIVAAGVWWWARFDTDAARSELEAEANWRSTVAALRVMMADHPSFSFSDVVIGPYSGDGLMDFRALVLRDGANRPAFGQARYRCAAFAPRPDCWEIAALMIDGKEVMPGGSKPETAAGTTERSAGQMMAATIAPAPDAAGDAAATRAPEDGAAAAGAEDARPAAVAAIASDPPPVPVPVPVPAPAAADGPTHVVNVSAGNARVGPGMDNAVAFVLTRGVPLRLVQDDGAWGRFVVLEGERTGSEVWMSFSIVAEAAGGGQN